MKAAVLIALVAACGGGQRAGGGDAIAVDGAITIVDFRADWCKACVRLEQMMAADLAGDRDIVVRKVDVGDGQTPIARAYDIHGLPHVNIYDRAGRLRYVLVGDDTIRTVEVARSLRSD
jgi:thiol-disulfide isomerase/thioredoxin